MNCLLRGFPSLCAMARDGTKDSSLYMPISKSYDTRFARSRVSRYLKSVPEQHHWDSEPHREFLGDFGFQGTAKAYQTLLFRPWDVELQKTFQTPKDIAALPGALRERELLEQSVNAKQTLRKTFTASRMLRGWALQMFLLEAYYIFH